MTMFQIKTTCGYELQCIGKGNGLSRVVRDSEIVFEGPHDACVAWLESRGIQPVSGKHFPRSSPTVEGGAQ